MMLATIPYKRYIEDHFSMCAKTLHNFMKAQRVIQLKSDITLTFRSGEGALIASYPTIHGEIIQQTFVFTSSKVGYGKRVFVRCPKCARAVNDLYMRGYFACRNCHQLYYTSNRKQRDRLQRLKMTITSTQTALKMPVNRTLTDYPTQKPLNMHQKTFERLLTELFTAQTEYVKCQNEGLQRLYERLR